MIQSRSIQLTQAVADLPSHAAQGRRQPLTMESLEKLFETAGSLASEAIAYQKLDFEMQL